MAIAMANHAGSEVNDGLQLLSEVHVSRTPGSSPCDSFIPILQAGFKARGSLG